MFEMGAKLEEDELNLQGSKNKKKDAKKNEIIAKNQHQLVFTFEKRRGKPVTLVGRFYISENEKKEILKLLKKKLACGGAIKGEWIELQGEVKQKIIYILSSEGWKFKK
jgi:translation initiation factor 1